MGRKHNKFMAGKKSSFEGAIVGKIFRDGECLGHELSSYRGSPMGTEIGDGCVLFRDLSENEELHRHIDWMEGKPYREASLRNR